MALDVATRAEVELVVVNVLTRVELVVDEETGVGTVVVVVVDELTGVELELVVVDNVTGIDELVLPCPELVELELMRVLALVESVF